MLANLAAIQELIAGAIPDRPALVWRDRALTYRELLDRSRRFANLLLELGLGCHVERQHLEPWQSGQDHVALYLFNCNEYLEAMYGCFHARAAAINVNYRYVEDELVCVLANSRARAIVYHSAFAPRLAEIRDRLPDLEHLIQVGDESGESLLSGAVQWDEAVARASAAPLELPRAADDLYVLYTGGTTGTPKGVLWRQEDVFFNGLGGHVPGFDRLDSEDKLLRHLERGIGGRFVVAMPFMHGAGHWSAFNTWHRGGTVVMPDENRRLDADSYWRAVERHGADQIGIVGDAFARPLIDALRRGRYDVSSVRVVMSTAAVLSPAVKEALFALLPPTALLVESIGGSEMGLQAMSVTSAAADDPLPSYRLRPGTVLLTSDRSAILEPPCDRAGADGEPGWIASTGHLPLGYLRDPERTERTFPMIGGVRYVVGGDRARYAADGSLVFLGRESACVNTGGEKVYVEEVERVVKSHPAIYDALVVGVANERWGQQVTAVVSIAPGAAIPLLDDLRAHCARSLAPYKIPRALVVAAEIVRSPSGKPDYAWAAGYAAAKLRVASSPPGARQ